MVIVSVGSKRSVVVDVDLSHEDMISLYNQLTTDINPPLVLSIKNKAFFKTEKIRYIAYKKSKLDVKGKIRFFFVFDKEDLVVTTHIDPHTFSQYIPLLNSILTSSTWRRIETDYDWILLNTKYVYGLVYGFLQEQLQECVGETTQNVEQLE